MARQQELDNITVEEVQAATQGTGMTILHKLCQAIWEQEKASIRLEKISYNPDSQKER